MEERHASTQKHEHGHHHAPTWWKRLHRNWRLWVVVALMLAAMLMYVLSDDESLQPSGGPPQAPMPAAGI